MTTLATIPTKVELESYQIIAKVASSNPAWKKLGGGGTEEQVVATILSVMLLARELGISPMQAISGGINNIQGKFEISARIMNQLIRKHGHILYRKILNNEMCVIWAKRKDTGEQMEVTYLYEEAVRAGLVKPGGGWAKNPQDMLFARCISRLARQLFPDCIGGCYIEGELQESILKKPVDAIDLPEIDQFNESEIPAKAIEIDFKLPSDLTVDSLNLFIDQSATVSGKPRQAVITRANQNPDGFITALRTWEDKRVPKEPELLDCQKLEENVYIEA